MFFLVLLIGFCIGSFLNVLIYRLPRGLTVIKGRSFCPKCKKRIIWYDNVPLFSFFILRGRCRFCKKRISFRYPFVELLTGILFVLAAFRLGDLGNLSYLSHLVVDWALISALIVVFFTDLENQIIPDQIIFLAIFSSSLSSLITNYKLLITSFLPAATISALFFWSLYLITKGKGMGFGDVKLAFLIGLVLGFPNAVIAFYLAFLTGAIVGVILILVKKVKFGQQISFGPFLATATLVTIFFGNRILCFLKNFF